MDKIDESVEGTPPYGAWWYDLHPHTKILNQMDCLFHYSDPHSGGWGDGLIVVENLKYGK